MPDEVKKSEKKKTKNVKQTSITIPEDLAKTIDDIVAEKTLGFDSRAGFVKAAIREYLLKYHQFSRKRGETKKEGS